MRVMMQSPHGSSLSVEFEDGDMTPDGVDTALRQVLDVYAGMIATDVASCLVDETDAVGLPEIETVVDGFSSSDGGDS